MLYSPRRTLLKKCLRIDIAFIKENLEKMIITKIHHVVTREQLANVLTKKGASQKKKTKSLSIRIYSIIKL